MLAAGFGLAWHGIGLAAAPGGIYLIGDAADAIHLSDRSQTQNARLLIETEAVANPVQDVDRPVSTNDHRIADSKPAIRAATPDASLSNLVDRVARVHRVEPELLHAVIAAESGYASRAVSSRGAQGLMQLMPATARDYGVTDPFDPLQNLDAGARHLRRLLDRFGQDTSLALAAYNAGPEAVARHRGRIPPYAETMAYVPRVLNRLAALRRESPSVRPGLHAFP